MHPKNKIILAASGGVSMTSTNYVAIAHFKYAAGRCILGSSSMYSHIFRLIIIVYYCYCYHHYFRRPNCYVLFLMQKKTTKICVVMLSRVLHCNFRIKSKTMLTLLTGTTEALVL